jgi:hypothetical protein
MAQGGGGAPFMIQVRSVVSSASDSVTIPDDMRVQPVGGAVLLEGNVEVRFPVWGDFLRGATFIDFGQVWRGEESVQLSQLQWTPGIGIRYFSPIGPIRIDVGYNPSGAERLSVVTTDVCDGSQDPCADIVDDVVYTRGDLQNRRQLRTLPAVTWKPFDSFRNRLQLHFSIGQAF